MPLSPVTTSRPRTRSTLSFLNKARSPSLLPSTSAQKPTNIPKVESQTKGPNHIRNFLKSCSPSLEHLLSQFVNVGFKSPEILKEVACRWSKDERLEVLRKLQVTEGDVSELELIALERRFQKYSSEIHNGL